MKKACAEIASFPPLVFAGECRTLQERLAKCATGEAFILQGGDCAEAFSQFSANRIRDLFRLILQVGVKGACGCAGWQRRWPQPAYMAAQISFTHAACHLHSLSQLFDRRAQSLR